MYTGFGVLELGLEGDLAFDTSAILETAVLVHEQLAQARQSVVEPAAVALRGRVHFGVLVLALERSLVAVPVYPMAVDLAVGPLVVVDTAVLVLVSGQLAHARQLVVDSAALVLA